MSNNGLIKYIKDCCKLEETIYLQKQVIDFLEENIDYYNDYRSMQYAPYRNKVAIPMEHEIFKQYPNYKRRPEAGNYTPCSGLYAIGDAAKEKPYSSDEVIIYLNAIKNLKFGRFESEKKKTLKKLNAYNEAVDRENKLVAKENETIKINSLKKVELLEIELNEQYKEKENSESLLQKYYDKDIIFVKYRNFVSLNAILEYLLSGRCSNLKEAYNKYEEELRQNIIIDKLDIVIDKLDAIEKSQYMLYNAIQNINDTLCNISCGINDALENLSSIKDNSEMIAYNSEISIQHQEYSNKLLTFNTVYNITKDFIT